MNRSFKNLDLPLFVGHFLQFVDRVKSQILGIDQNFVWQGVAIESDGSEILNQDPETIARKLWDTSASLWPAVESIGNYKVTMISILEHFSKIEFPKQPIKILSLGSGPGLYEIFLAWVLSEHGVSFRLHSIDFSQQMICLQEKILGHDAKLGKVFPRKIRDKILPKQGDMTDLPEHFTGNFDCVIVNNSLQWVVNWQKAVAEIARVIKPNSSIGDVLLFVHPHAMKAMAGDCLIQFPEVTFPALLDELEKNNLKPNSFRQMSGTRGTGQVGSSTNRILIRAKFAPQGIDSSWRSRPVQGFSANLIPA
jgi:SAM-dependent methyltransferase